MFHKLENRDYSGLNNATWDALHGPQSNIAEKTELACAYMEGYYNFAAIKEDTEKAYKELASIVSPGRIVAISRRDNGHPIEYPEWNHLGTPKGYRMVIETPIKVPDLPIEKLTIDDAAEMIALTKSSSNTEDLTLNKIEVGDFYGIKDNGRVIAMAGERLQLEDYSEVSGVVTHPDYRKRGYGGGVTLYKCKQIQKMGKTPFLGVWETNTGAVRLYQKLGFKILHTGYIELLQRTDHPIE
jgi:ribosomal protein S18 acetylase RimI-like enzyme